MRKHLQRDHAVDDIEILEAIVVEVAELGRPAPACAIQPIVARQIVGSAAGIKHIFHDLRVAFGVWHAHHHVHDRLPLRQGGIVKRIRLHIHGEKLARAVIVEVGGIITHGAVWHDSGRVAFLPAIAIDIMAVGHGEVVADDDFAFAGAILSRINSQRIGTLADARSSEALAQILIINHASQRRSLPQQQLVFYIIAARDEVEVAIAVGIQPIHGIGDVTDAAQQAGFELSAAQIAPEEGRGRLLRKDDIQPAIAIDIDDCCSAGRRARGQGLALKLQAAAIPQNGIVAAQIRQDDIQPAVLVQVVHRQPRAIAIIKADWQFHRRGDVIQLMTDENAAAVAARIQRDCLDRHRHMDADGLDGRDQEQQRRDQETWGSYWRKKTSP